MSSPSNPIVSTTARLLKDGAYRKESGLAAVEGFRLVEDVVGAGAEVRWILVSEELASRHPSELDRLLGSGSLYLVPAGTFKRVSSTVTPQGIVAVVRTPRRRLSACSSGRLIALDGVQEPGNAGTLIRSAAAFGFGVVVMPGTVDIYSPKVLRSSMGGVFRTPVFFCDGPGELVAFSRNRGMTIWIADNRGGMPVNLVRIDDNIIIVLGNEAHGALSFSDMEQETAKRMTVPMEKGVESLNVAMAGTIIMYESFRSRQTWRC